MARAITPQPPAPQPNSAKTTHTTPMNPTTAMRHSAMPISMPVCLHIRAARAAMPVRAMMAPGGPMTPRKHIQASQDAAAMNASRNGSAARASRKRQIGKRGAGVAGCGVRSRRERRHHRQMGWA